MQMDAGLDTGPVLARRATPIGKTETTGQLHDRLSAMGAAMIVETLQSLDALTPVAQPENGVTYASKIDKAEAAIDWTRPATQIDRQIRGLSPFPGAWTEHADTRIKLLGASMADGGGAPGEVLDNTLRVACGDGAVQLTRLQRAGKGPQDVQDFLRGMPLPAGTMLGG